MEKALATFRNGQVQFDAAVDWPEGTRLEVAPAVTKVGLEESEWPQTPEQKEAWLEWLKNLEPFDMTSEELDAFEADLKVSKEIQKQLLRKSWHEESRS
jgi:hypothetical protein